MEKLKKNNFIGQSNHDENFGALGVLQFLDYESLLNFARTKKAYFDTCKEFYNLNEITKKKLNQKLFEKDRARVQSQRAKFLETRQKLNPEEKEKLDLEFFEELKKKSDNLYRCIELYNQGASISFLNQGHEFDNFTYLIRRDKHLESLEKCKLSLDSILKIEDLQEQKADITENETFFQILFLKEFNFFYKEDLQVYKASYELFYNSALNFDIRLAVKDIIESPYYQVFRKYEYCLESGYSQEEEEEEIFQIFNPSEETKTARFVYQLKFLEFIADNFELLMQNPYRTSQIFLKAKLNPHVNVLLSTFEEYSSFHKSKFSELKLLGTDNEYDSELEYDIQSYEKGIKMLIGLLPVYYKYKQVFLRDLLDRLFLQYKGLVFKYLETNRTVDEDLKSVCYQYLFKKYFKIDLSLTLKAGANFVSENVDYDKLIEKKEFYKNLESAFFEDEEDIKNLYESVVAFLVKNSKTVIIQQILAFEKSHNSTKFNTRTLLHPITGLKLFSQQDN